MKKRAILLFLTSLLLLSTVLAQEEQNTEIGFFWLNKTLEESNWNKAVDEISYSILALDLRNDFNLTRGVNKLLSQQKSDGSWNNRVKDTSLAILALNSRGLNNTKAINWLKSKEKEAITQGNWYLQIITEYQGTDSSCELTVGDRNPIGFRVNKSGVSCDSDNNGDNWGPWFDIERCGNINLGKFETIDLDCANLGSVDMALIYRNENNYYLLDQKEDITTWRNLEIENAYFGDYESTSYATWVLTKVGEADNIHTLSYLISNARENNIIDHAILFDLTKENSYKTWLENQQNNFTGSWENNVYTTSLTSLTLKSANSLYLDKAFDWLRSKQNLRSASTKYGSWNNDVVDTSIALYALFSDSDNFPIPNYECNSNSRCEPELNENFYNCPTDCISSTQGCGPEDECSASNPCEASDEECNLDLCACEKVDNQIECDDSHPCEDADDQCINGICLFRPNTTCTSEDECSASNPCEASDEECNLDLCACEKTESPCTSNSECDPPCGECLSGSCRKKFDCCENDDECLSDEKCDLETNKCIEKSKFPWWVITVGILFIAGLIIFYFLKFKKPKSKRPLSEVEEMLGPKKEKPVMIPRFRSNQEFAKQTLPKRRDIYEEQLEKELDKSLKRAKELIDKDKR